MGGDITFGAWLKRRRRQLDLTQKGLAHRADCSVGTIRKMEADERRPSRQLAVLLAQHLKIPSDQLESFIAFARSEPLLSEVSFPTMTVAEVQIPSIPEGTHQPLPHPTPEQKLKHNLPTVSPQFIGRGTELTEIQAKLKELDCRLLTLLGPGGSGKTRLAIEAARTALADFPHGVFFVSLAPVQEADKIP